MVFHFLKCTHAHRHTQDACNETADLLVLRHSDAGLTSHLALPGVETLRCHIWQKLQGFTFLHGVHESDQALSDPTEIWAEACSQ